MKTRRRILTLGGLAVAGALYKTFPEGAKAPGVDASVSGHEAWREGLGSLAEWVTLKRGGDGVVEAHCGVADFAHWAGIPNKIAGCRTPVKGNGNVLSFKRGGEPFRVVMHAPDAVV